jgi:hypothetical protein
VYEVYLYLTYFALQIVIVGLCLELSHCRIGIEKLSLLDISISLCMLDSCEMHVYLA